MKLTTSYKDLLDGKGFVDKGIDFDTRMRYVDRDGLRFWEHGEVHIKCGNTRNPKQRRALRSILDVRVHMLAEVRYKLFTPDGMQLTKSQIKDAPVLLLDQEHKTIVNVSRYDSVIYKSADSPPVARNPIRVSTLNQLAERDLWPQVLQLWEVLKVKKRMGLRAPEAPKFCYYDVCNRLDAWVCTPTATEDAVVLNELWNMPREKLRKLFRHNHDLVISYPYLITKGDI